MPRIAQCRSPLGDGEPEEILLAPLLYRRLTGCSQAAIVAPSEGDGMKRRTFAKAALSAAIVTSASRVLGAVGANPSCEPAGTCVQKRRLANIEAESGGRLGFFAVDAGS